MASLQWYRASKVLGWLWGGAAWQRSHGLEGCPQRNRFLITHDSNPLSIETHPPALPAPSLPAALSGTGRELAASEAVKNAYLGG